MAVKNAVLSDGKTKIKFNVLSESDDYSNTVSENPVEQGVSVSDHIKNEAIKLSVSGIIVDTDHAKKLTQLKSFRNQKKILTYTGRNNYPNMVIESLTTDHPADVRNGFTFSLSLKQIRIAKTKFISLTNVTLKTTYKKASAKTKKGKKTTKTKADKSVKTALDLYVKGKAGAK